MDAALKTAAHVIESTFDTQPIEIAFLEPEACLVLPQGNGVKVITDSQGSVYDHQQIAKILKLDPKDVEISLLPSGGAFGAKEELAIHVQPAVAAMLLGRPVKTVLTREQWHRASRETSRDDRETDHRRGCGRTSARAAVAHHRGCRRLSHDERQVRPARSVAPVARCGSVYRIPNVDVDAKAVYTNNPNAGAMRGFGSNQAQFAMEGIMDMLAEKVAAWTAGTSANATSSIRATSSEPGR